MLQYFTYERIIAAVIVIAVAWIILILFRVARGKVIRKADFLRSNWKIVLFWMIVATIVIAVLYFKKKWGM